MEHGRVRALEIKVADPRSIEAIDEQTRSVANSLRAFRDLLGTSRISLTLSKKRGEADIPQARVLSMFRWLKRVQEDEPKNVKALRASVIPPDGTRPDWLDLLDAQSGARTKVDLPADNPDKSYEMRRDFAISVLKRHNDEVEGEGG